MIVATVAMGISLAVGYMRTASPSGSEWGDPTHGRLYITSTATSSRASSTSNLLRVQDKESKQGLTLPPLILPITNKKPLITPMLDRFEFTRAWAFSYHNSTESKNAWSLDDKVPNMFVYTVCYSIHVMCFDITCNYS